MQSDDDSQSARKQAQQDTAYTDSRFRRVSGPLSDHGLGEVRRLTTAPLVEQEELKPSKMLPALRPHRLVTTLHDYPASGANVTLSTPLPAGTWLHGERYCLREVMTSQSWLSGTVEVTWRAHDVQRAETSVTICELLLPPTCGLVTVQSLLRKATIALTSAGRLSYVPMLWDVFSEAGHYFFVFEPVEGEALHSRMQRCGQCLPEREVVDCCYQMTSVLEALAQQSPPLVHGRLRPENILVNRVATHSTLTNFSLVLAGEETQFITGIERASLSPYSAPEFANQPGDGRADLYSLLATAYHMLTGSLPVASDERGSIFAARRLNAQLSPGVEAVLTKGLQPLAGRRYQSATELKHDLRALRAQRAVITQNSTALPVVLNVPTSAPFPLSTSVSLTPVPALPAVSAPLQQVASSDELMQKLLQPRLEQLRSFKQRDLTIVLFWGAGLLMIILLWLLLNHLFG